MNNPRQVKINRRAAVALGVAAAAWPRLGAAKAFTQRGMVGGGLVRLEGGEANFSLFASSYEVEGQQPAFFAGSLIWDDAGAEAAVASTRVTHYGPLEGHERGRHVEGFATINGAGNHPFALDVIDGGAPASGDDTVALTVGEDGAPAFDGAPPADRPVAYAAAGALASGDVQDVDVDVPDL